MNEIPVAIRRLDHAGDLPLPRYESEGAAGLDLLAAVESDLILPPGGTATVPTGISIALPVSLEAQVRPRSGLAAKHGVTVLNAPGTVDSDYRGEIKVILVNHGKESLAITRGMRIAQLVIAPVQRIVWQEGETLPESTRGAGGFGSTGLRSLSE